MNNDEVIGSGVGEWTLIHPKVPEPGQIVELWRGGETTPMVCRYLGEGMFEDLILEVHRPISPVRFQIPGVVPWGWRDFNCEHVFIQDQNPNGADADGNSTPR